MNCPYCQREMTPQGNRCPLCGGNLNVRLCPRGHVMDPSWDDCHFCPRPDDPIKIKEKTELDYPQPALGKSGTVIEYPAVPGAGKGQTVDEPRSASGKLVGWLVSFTWDKAGQDFRLREGKNLIGRDPSAGEIAIPQDSRMSNLHATLIYRNGRFLIGDEHSMNGTFVNDKDVSEVQLYELQNNDLITLGDTQFKLKTL